MGAIIQETIILAWSDPNKSVQAVSEPPPPFIRTVKLAHTKEIIMIDIFLSRPTWVGDKYSKGLENFIRFLKSHELNPRTIGTSDYPTESPLDEVIALMDKCSGAVILGYPQIIISGGFIKDRKIESEIMLPTEWNHIETGLAYAKGLPVLLIQHKGVKRGVFDRGAVNKFLYEVDFSDQGWPLTEPVSGAITSWLPKVKSFKPIPSAVQKKEKTILPSNAVTIGTLQRPTLATDIRAKIVLTENKQPSVDLFLDRIKRTSPYCPKCSRPLVTKHASWMADGVQIGYKCKKCTTEYDGDYSDVFNEILSEVRRDYQSYWQKYRAEIEAMTNGQPENYTIP